MPALLKVRGDVDRAVHLAPVMPPKVILPAGHLCVEGFAVRVRGLEGLVPQGELFLLFHLLVEDRVGRCCLGKRAGRCVNHRGKCEGKRSPNRNATVAPPPPWPATDHRA